MTEKVSNMQGTDSMEKSVKGTLTGIGVGPGDPELMTIKAVRILEKTDVIACPGDKAGESVAYNIALQAVPGINQKEVIGVSMPMTTDGTVLQNAHMQAALMIEKYLSDGLNVAFLTLGDISIYSTYAYIEHIVKEHGYSTDNISGITSFSAAASACGISLCEKNEALHIIPANYTIPDVFESDNNYVLMKVGNRLDTVKEKLSGCERDVVLIENCGMDGERIYRGLKNLPEKAGYYSLIIIH